MSNKEYIAKLKTKDEVLKLGFGAIKRYMVDIGLEKPRFGTKGDFIKQCLARRLELCPQEVVEVKEEEVKVDTSPNFDPNDPFFNNGNPSLTNKMALDHFVNVLSSTDTNKLKNIFQTYARQSNLKCSQVRDALMNLQSGVFLEQRALIESLNTLWLRKAGELQELLHGYFDPQAPRKVQLMFTLMKIPDLSQRIKVMACWETVKESYEDYINFYESLRNALPLISENREYAKVFLASEIIAFHGHFYINLHMLSRGFRSVKDKGIEERILALLNDLKAYCTKSTDVQVDWKAKNMNVVKDKMGKKTKRKSRISPKHFSDEVGDIIRMRNQNKNAEHRQSLKQILKKSAKNVAKLDKPVQRRNVGKIGASRVGALNNLLQFRGPPPAPVTIEDEKKNPDGSWVDNIWRNTGNDPLPQQLLQGAGSVAQPYMAPLPLPGGLVPVPVAQPVVAPPPIPGGLVPFPVPQPVVAPPLIPVFLVPVPWPPYPDVDLPNNQLIQTRVDEKSQAPPPLPPQALPQVGPANRVEGMSTNLLAEIRKGRPLPGTDDDEKVERRKIASFRSSLLTKNVKDEEKQMISQALDEKIDLNDLDVKDDSDQDGAMILVAGGPPVPGGRAMLPAEEPEQAVVMGNRRNIMQELKAGRQALKTRVKKKDSPKTTVTLVPDRSAPAVAQPNTSEDVKLADKELKEVFGHLKNFEQAWESTRLDLRRRTMVVFEYQVNWREKLFHQLVEDSSGLPQASRLIREIKEMRQRHKVLAREIKSLHMSLIDQYTTLRVDWAKRYANIGLKQVAEIAERKYDCIIPKYILIEIWEFCTTMKAMKLIDLHFAREILKNWR